MSKILVAIPAYNCEKQLVRVIQDILQHPSLYESIEQFLIIDNQSTDHTLLLSKEYLNKNDLKKKFKIIKNLKNIGLGGSQKVAFKWAQENKFDYLAVLHGDHQAQFIDLEDMIKVAYVHNQLSAVLGSRFSYNSKRINYSKVRILGNMVLNFIYSLSYFKFIVDLGSGLNLFKVSDYDLKELAGFSNNFTFNMDIICYLNELKKDYHFLPITWTESDQKSNANNLKVGMNSLKTLIYWKLKQKKIDCELFYSFETIY